MRRSLVKFSGPKASNHTPSLADFITTTSGFELSVHTAGAIAGRLISVELRLDGLAVGRCQLHHPFGPVGQRGRGTAGKARAIDRFQYDPLGFAARNKDRRTLES